MPAANPRPVLRAGRTDRERGFDPKNAPTVGPDVAGPDRRPYSNKLLVTRY